MFKIENEDFDIKKIAESGQCFRMCLLETDEKDVEKWQLIALDKLAFIYSNNEDVIIDCPEEDNIFWIDYFDLNTDYSRFRFSVREDDIFLLEAVKFGKGIRILKQDPWEMLITFIISQRRSIPSIKTCVERLCKNYGSKIKDDVFAFPTPKQLASADISELSDCGLGYRAEYVYLASKSVANGSLDLNELKSLNNEELFNELTKLRGVGPKVANCVSLFGYYRIAAFPIDVWIERVLNQYYNGTFPTNFYEGYAGVMQQYMFYYIRNC